MEKESRILVVDDDKNICELIRLYLQKEGYTVEIANDGLAALEKFSQNPPAAVILDIMLPKIDGITVCQKVREFSAVPIIMLTAKAEDMDKIMGLEYGADDYITKPFNILELKARVKAILRRTAPVSVDKSKISYGSITLDYNQRKIIINGSSIDLTSKEFDLMDLFLSNPEKVYSRDNLLDLIWGYDYPGDARTVDVHIRRLREKIEPNSAEPKYIMTKWGAGYYFKS